MYLSYRRAAYMDIEIMTIDDVLYMGMKNDMAFLLTDIANMYEQQSTYNPNMPALSIINVDHPHAHLNVRFGLYGLPIRCSERVFQFQYVILPKDRKRRPLIC